MLDYQDGFLLTREHQAQILSNALQDLGYPILARFIRKDPSDDKTIKTFTLLAYKQAERKKKTDVLELLTWAELI